MPLYDRTVLANKFLARYPIEYVPKHTLLGRVWKMCLFAASWALTLCLSSTTSLLSTKTSISPIRGSMSQNHQAKNQRQATPKTSSKKESSSMGPPQFHSFSPPTIDIKKKHMRIWYTQGEKIVLWRLFCQTFFQNPCSTSDLENLWKSCTWYRPNSNGDRRISEPSTDVYRCFWGIYRGGNWGIIGVFS